MPDSNHRIYRLMRGCRRSFGLMEFSTSAEAETAACFSRSPTPSLLSPSSTPYPRSYRHLVACTISGPDSACLGRTAFASESFILLCKIRPSRSIRGFFLRNAVTIEMYDGSNDSSEPPPTLPTKRTTTISSFARVVDHRAPCRYWLLWHDLATVDFDV